MPNYSRIFLPNETLYVKDKIRLIPGITFGSSSFYNHTVVGDTTCLGDCIVKELASDCGSLDRNKFPYYIEGNLNIKGKIFVLSKTLIKIEV